MKLLENISSQISKFRTKNQIKINYQSRGVIILIVTLDLKL